MRGVADEFADAFSEMKRRATEGVGYRDETRYGVFDRKARRVGARHPSPGRDRQLRLVLPLEVYYQLCMLKEHGVNHFL